MLQSRSDLGELEPIRAALAKVSARRSAARLIHADQMAQVLADVERELEAAIADAARPPAGGLSVEEYAERVGLSTWAIYKKVRRGEIAGARKRAGRIILPAP
jgi:predicted transcriptional regulator